MRVLYSTFADYDNLTPYGNRLDYQADSLFHGFRSLLGEDAVDAPKMCHMYRGPAFKLIKQDKCKGFTLYNRLDDIEVDRENIYDKLRCDYFDYVIMPIHHSKLHSETQIIDRVAQLRTYMPENKVIVVDGNDETRYFESILKYSWLFKRELTGVKRSKVEPISFSIPEEIVVTQVPEKTQDFAKLIPSYLHRGHPHERTYIYDDEIEYYRDYQRSYYGFTCKKGGWDTLRHYEILANGCVPYFTDIERLPALTMHNFPIHICKRLKEFRGVYPNWIRGPICVDCMEGLYTEGHRIDHTTFCEDEYYGWVEYLLRYLNRYLTTKAMAKYVLDTVGIK